MTTQPSDWAVARALELSMQSLKGPSVRAYDWVMMRARELDASGGGFTDEQVQRAWDAFCEVAHAKTGDDWGEVDPIPAMRAALLTATPRAAEAATTNSAQISSSLGVGDVGEDTRCRHENGRPGYDLWHCSDCGAVKTDSGWGIAKHRYFNDRAEAEFFRKHGRLPDDGKPQPWGNAAMGAVGAGGGDHG